MRREGKEGWGGSRPFFESPSFDSPSGNNRSLSAFSGPGMPEEDPSSGRVEEKGEEGRSVRGGEEGGWGGLMARGPLWIDAISVLLHVTSWLGRLMWRAEGRGDGVLEELLAL
jgi:hypothetical protein